tara:strand:+ start:97 stop:351 length:255 start_codon:yes stop_codon:yes gene_type:complete
MEVSNMATALETLRMKNILLTAKEKSRLIGELTLDEKRLLGALMLEEDISIETENTSMEELDGSLSFGNKTYEDGMETFVNNRE